MCPYPCDSDQVCLYMSILVRRLCYSSIYNYLSGLNNHLKDLGCLPIDYSDHGIKKCMAAIHRVKGSEVEQAAPLLPLELLNLFRVMCISPGHVAVQAAMLLSFRALLRKDHVTDSDCSLVRSDLVVHPWGLMFWVHKHLEQCPAPASAKAFRMPRKGGSVPLPYSYYTAVLKSACRAAGMHPGEFSSHSLRRG